MPNAADGKNEGKVIFFVKCCTAEVTLPPSIGDEVTIWKWVGDSLCNRKWVGGACSSCSEHVTRPLLPVSGSATLT